MYQNVPVPNLHRPRDRCSGTSQPRWKKIEAPKRKPCPILRIDRLAFEAVKYTEDFARETQ